MKKEMYIIVLHGENGGHHTVKKVFETLEKADVYAKNNCSYINHGYGNGGLEKVTSKSITKVEVV